MTATQMTDRQREAVYGRTPNHVQDAVRDLRNARDRWRWAQDEIRLSTDREWTLALIDERSEAFKAMSAAEPIVRAYCPDMARELLAA